MSPSPTLSSKFHSSLSLQPHLLRKPPNRKVTKSPALHSYRLPQSPPLKSPSAQHTLAHLGTRVWQTRHSPSRTIYKKLPAIVCPQLLPVCSPKLASLLVAHSLINLPFLLLILLELASLSGAELILWGYGSTGNSQAEEVTFSKGESWAFKTSLQRNKTITSRKKVQKRPES